MRAEFGAAARSIVVPQARPEPRPRRRRGRGDSGHRLTTAALADSYLKLCHDPFKDLHRWIAEDKKRPGPQSRAPPRAKETAHEITPLRTTSLVEDARRLCGRPLYQVQGRLDANGITGRIADDLPPGSRAGAGGNDQLRSLRAQGGRDLNVASADAHDSAGELASALGALSGYFASRRAAIRRSANPGDVAAALRALQDEQMLAMRALVDQWRVAGKNAGERRRPTVPARPIGAHSLSPTWAP